MSVTLELQGFDELLEALRRLPEEFTGEAAHLIEARGNRAGLRIKGEYPPGSGLQEQTSVTFERQQFATAATVRTASPHANLYEKGTVTRQYITVAGNRHLTGRMPARHVYGRVMSSERRALFADLADLLKRKGLEVSDDGR